MNASAVFLANSLFGLTCLSMRADFERWTNKDGKTAEMEITGLENRDTGTTVAFNTKADRTVTLRLADLSPEDQSRAKAWNAGAKVSANFRSARNTGSGTPQFCFELNGRGPIPLSALKIKNAKLLEGGRELPGVSWVGAIDYARETSPFAREEPDASDLILVITAESSPGEVVPANCDFSADVELIRGSVPKEVSGIFKVPKDDEGNPQTLGPLTVSLIPGYWRRSEQPKLRKKGVREDDEDEGVSGYCVQVDSEPAEEGNNDGMVIGRSIFTDGKEYKNGVDKEKAAASMKVVVKYWSVESTMQIQVKKAANEEGSKPLTTDQGKVEGDR